MASRLALKYGVVSEEDRLSNSSDAVLVTEPTTGSKARTKGSLYLVVTSRNPGGRTRDACRLVADTIRREYYYDESAGIAIVLEKAVRAANRRLRHSREGGGLAAGALGVAVAVVRGNELYVATCGDADSYLIRAARLLMPEHDSGAGLPAADNVRVDVWRGDFSVGDSLVLCSRNLVEVVGTEELKNAVVTLHPQSAVEHLHHLFVAAGGDGSDAVLTIEATEVSLSRVEHRLVPVNASEPLAGAEPHSPIPLADQLSGAASAVRDRGVAARLAVRDGISRVVGGVLDLMPRRRPAYKRIGTAATKRETQRRAAIAILAFISVVAVLGVVIVVLDPFREDTPIVDVTQGEAAFADARANADEVFGSANLMTSDPARARTLLREAWTALERAEESGVVDEDAIAEERDRVRVGLDELHGTIAISPTPIFAVQDGARLGALVRGPTQDIDAAYAIAGTTIVRIDTVTGVAAVVAREGAGAGVGLSVPRILARGGPDILVLDDAGALWRWRPSDEAGNGTIGQLVVAGEQTWNETVLDIETFLIDAEQGRYRLYVPYPPGSQVLRYEPTADGGGFSAPGPYFESDNEDVTAFRELLVDGDVYALTPDDVLRYFNGRRSGAFELAELPDAGDIRPGHDYRFMTATGSRGVGTLYVYDALHARILGFDKTDGAFVEQFVAAPGASPLSDVTGMYVIDRGELEPPVLVYARADGVYQVALVQPAAVAPSPSPSGTPPSGTPPSSPAETNGVTTPPATARPTSATEVPVTPTPEPTLRPRRTPRPQP